MSAGVEGKVAIVTGGASGLGAATARKLAAEGASVVIADVNAEGAESVAAEAGGHLAVRQTDIGDEAQVRALTDWVADRYGRIDVMVNVAALLPPPDAQVADIALDGWNAELRVSLTGAMLMSKHVIPHMIKAGGGSIVHFASTAALRGMDSFTGYQVTKSGVIGLSRAIAMQYGKRGIRSNTVAPGAITSRPRPEEVLQRLRDNTMVRELGTPEDIAAIVLFFASDASRLLTAQVVAGDGGATMRLPTVGTPEQVSAR